MKKSLVYLAGPISGTTYLESNDWRKYVANNVPEFIEVISPLRSKSYLGNLSGEGDGKKIADYYSDYSRFPLSSKRGIMMRDSFDVRRADAILVNLLDAQKISIGTVMEIAWAWDHQKPIVCICQPGHIHTHSMLDEAISLTAENLDEGIWLISQILGTGV